MNLGNKYPLNPRGNKMHLSLRSPLGGGQFPVRIWKRKAVCLAKTLGGISEEEKIPRDGASKQEADCPGRVETRSQMVLKKCTHGCSDCVRERGLRRRRRAGSFGLSYRCWVIRAVLGGVLSGEEEEDPGGRE